MMYKITKSSARGSSPNFIPGQLLFLRKNPTHRDADFFIFLGQSGECMRLGKVRFDERRHGVETTEEIAIPPSERGQFGRLSHLVAVEA